VDNDVVAFMIAEQTAEGADFPLIVQTKEFELPIVFRAASAAGFEG
jgi:hypothetical protein